MPDFRIVLVEPKSEGNVGAVARVMKNFGQAELVLVTPPPLRDEAKGRAMHAWDLIERAQKVEELDEALKGCDFVVGTSARIPPPDKTYLRIPIDAREFPDRIRSTQGRIALLFGREDFGLFNEELERCDLLITIPTSSAYKSLNLSQAVGIVLYELYVQFQAPVVQGQIPMSGVMRDQFQRTFERLVDAMELPEHKTKNIKTVYRKLFGRAIPSAWEYFVLMGVFRRCLEKFGQAPSEGRDLEDFDVPEDVPPEFLRLLESGA